MPARSPPAPGVPARDGAVRFLRATGSRAIAARIRGGSCPPPEVRAAEWRAWIVLAGGFEGRDELSRGTWVTVAAEWRRFVCRVVSGGRIKDTFGERPGAGKC